MAFKFSPSAAPRLSDLAPEFLQYARVELQFSEQSIVKYRDCFRQIERVLGDLPVDHYAKEHVLELKAHLLSRQLSISRQVSILSALKRVLMYVREQGVAVLDPELITIPKRPRREVTFLKADEVQRFVAAIPLQNQDGRPSFRGFRFRALVEVLLGSAMRIGEALSLNRDQIDFEAREARIVGKGNKERVVFFTERSLYWLKQYLQLRTDYQPAVFVVEGAPHRLPREDIWRLFQRHRLKAGMNKRITPHLLRHTAATQLLFNGCPVGHIKEILGHERLETTCRYYLGLDHRAAKAAHQQYLTYQSGSVDRK